jgi:UDP-N-acetylmuramate: L-alanyl-gamma-D-glutamyl-meso-diaminopimelate ligase
MHLHILGICGTFMGGLALIARAAGHRVTGCDAGVYPPMSTQLKEQGIELIEGFDPKQLAFKPDLFVIGNIVSRGNPLMEAILEAGLPYTSGPQWLGDFVLQHQHVLAVAGTHGKTTTSSMLAWILQYVGKKPNFLIGGVAPGLEVSARFDAAQPFFVIEADEYDTAFFDKRSKFVHYRPRTAILNNLEYDHADIFPDLTAIEIQFHHLLRTVPRNGLVITPAQDEALERVIERGCWAQHTLINTLDGWHTHTRDAMSFEISKGSHRLGIIQWTQTGAHNQHNALAAIVAAHHVGIPPDESIAALCKFSGVKRRMEIRGNVRNITIYDDFAHHPTAIATTLAGLRAQIGTQRILAVLEPRSNTMKLGTMAARLPEALTDADLVFCYGQRAGKQALGWEPVEVLASLGPRMQAHHEIEPLIQAIKRAAQAGDHIVIMSNGGFAGVHGRLLEALAASPA